jgi:hypothetical protein
MRESSTLEKASEPRRRTTAGFGLRFLVAVAPGVEWYVSEHLLDVPTAAGVTRFSAR